MKVEMTLHGLDGVIEALRRLPPDVVSKRGGPVLSALKKGARVIHKPAKAALVASRDPDTDSDGILAKNLIVSRGKAPTSGKGERVLIRVRKKVYRRTAKEVTTTLKTAQIKEYGSEKQAAEPWLRPAFQAHAAEAIDVASKSVASEIDRFMDRKLPKRRR